MASAVVSDNFETSSGGVPNLGGTGATTCKAWVNYNSIANTIRDSYNVSSITDNGAGDWTVNFTNAMGNANYSVTKSGYSSTTGTTNYGWDNWLNSTNNSLSTTSVRLVSGYPASSSTADMEYNFIQVFSN